MKRELKFRAYNPETKVMVTNLTMSAIAKEAEFKLLFTLDCYELSQYTGLKDKNGTDIYEGDILRNEKSSKSDFFVKFNVGGYDAVYKGNFTLCLYPVLSEYDGAEIIGNIYEHPGLFD